MAADIPTITIMGFDPLHLELPHTIEPITRVNVQLPTIHIKLFSFDMLGVGDNDEFIIKTKMPALQVLVTLCEPTPLEDIVATVVKSADHWRDLWHDLRNEAQATIDAALLLSV